MPTFQRLILASGSTGRRYLLEQAGYRFDVMPSGVEEDPGTNVTDPRRYVAELAWHKAAAVAAQVNDSALILAADSTVWFQSKIIGKPADEAEARHILGSLAGTVHELWTGVCLWRRPDDVQVCWQELSTLFFKKLSPRELEDLIATKVWEGKAGGYGIETHGDPYLTVRSGTVSNVVGLPMESLAQQLSWFAPELMPQRS
jgi:septum formation protein